MLNKMLNKFFAAALTAIATSGLLTLVLSVYAFFEESDEDVYFSRSFDLFPHLHVLFVSRHLHFRNPRRLAEETIRFILP